MEITILISIATAVSGILLGWLGRTRTIRQDAAKDAEAGATLQTDVEYIKRGVDDIRVDVRIQSQRLDGISERVTRVEESTKQAHKRLDRLEE
ncbi:hypothetical protein QNH46_17245 [Paenibacillus woosongensis]|uniref:t-SNARE coiled-coil homology domain-containing protein n=1 Tax=Paenibacillus woosongensis TaxID=307580 RepID=A0A7X2Z1D1_9BACL|nr:MULTISPECIES: hypothetical protein [Paenibacillus]MUG45233.1 hypothetical protein [Paenibacillus woosongensis]WHX47871.1 hypothetical protein QNH46_17245 [Paenibacillus woosongensis]